MSYQCTICGDSHAALPDLTFDLPAVVYAIPESARETRVELDTDLCAVDNEHFFIRAVLLIPIIASNNNLGFGIWLTQQKDNFLTYLENYDTSEIGPFHGRLANEFNFGGAATENLKAMAYFQGNGQRPLVELEQADHPLYIAQQNGITLDAAWRFMHEYLD